MTTNRRCGAARGGGGGGGRGAPGGAGGGGARGARVAVGTARASSFVGWRCRGAAMRRDGQTTTGLVEDAVVLAGGLAIASPKAVTGRA